ncbi:hypothetical protein JY419_02210 [Stenotrophomonas maltophilia]|nr:hypothetical protein [Stenotrophomonas maltophilia]
MKNADMPAIGPARLAGEDRFACAPGLTKRELIAAMAMQGLVASGKAWDGPMGWIGEEAVRIADALLDTLEKTV